jgi:hypothetical protein
VLLSYAIGVGERTTVSISWNKFNPDVEMFAANVNNSSVFLPVWLFSCVVLRLPARSVSVIINNGGIELTCEKVWANCVWGKLIERLLLFSDKSATQWDLILSSAFKGKKTLLKSAQDLWTDALTASFLL